MHKYKIYYDRGKLQTQTKFNVCNYPSPRYFFYLDIPDDGKEAETGSQYRLK